VEARDHLRITGSALKNWFIAQSQDALAVGLLWLIGLLLIGVPWAPLWAFLAAILQFVPQVGAVLGMLFPLAAAVLTDNGEPIFWYVPAKALYVLILYAINAVVDGLVLQPWLMRRTAKVPLWASILFPIVGAILLPPWGAILAPPILAVVYAYRRRHLEAKQINLPTPPRA